MPQAVLVGHQLQPGEASTKPDGTVVRTMWGEMAYQLGAAEGYGKLDRELLVPTAGVMDISFESVDGSQEETNKLVKSLQRPALHSATFGHEEVKKLQLPTEHADSRCQDWDTLWRLHTQYVQLLGWRYEQTTIERRRVSFLLAEQSS